jgi:tetratricopeptide (TPR) repeat protein
MADGPDPRQVSTIPQFQAAFATLLKVRGSLRRIVDDLDGLVSRSTIGEILNRTRFPRVSTVEIVARKLDPANEREWVGAWHRVQERPAGPAPLPAGTLTFRGRDAETAELTRVLLGSIDDGALPNVVIDGMAGVGKTAFALHVAHAVQADFPDGCVYLDMRGYSASAEPRTWDDAVSQVMRKLGHQRDDPVADPEERLDAYRDLLERSAVLVVLDDARLPEQVAPLLAGAGRSRVVVVSRRQMPSLDDALPISLASLNQDEAVALLRAVIPVARLAGQDEDLVRLVDLLAGLPLALRILAAKLVRRRMLTVAHLVDRVTDRYRRLGELEDGARSVRAAFRVSYEELDERQRRFFRVLGVVPGADIEPERAAASAGVGIDEAERLLEGFLDSNLLMQPAPGRYRLHDLVNDYAAEEAGSDADEQAATRQLILTWTTSTCRIRSVELFAAGNQATSAERATARDWFLRERENLVACVQAAVTWGMAEPAVTLGALISPALFLTGHYDDVITVAGLRLDAASGTGDEVAGGCAHLDAGQAALRIGRRDQAMGHCRAALAAFDQAGDQARQGAVLREMGNIAWYGNEYRSALARYDQALELQRASGDESGEATTLSNIGAAYQQLGDPGKALSFYGRALLIRRRIGDLFGVAQTLNNIGLTHERQGAAQQAMDALNEALEIGSALAGRAQTCATLTNLGNVCRRMRRFAEGEIHLRRAVEMAQQLKAVVLEAEALNCLGDLLHAAGRDDEAAAAHEEAFALTRGGVDRFEEAHALEGLGTISAAGGDLESARTWLGAAADLYRTLGAIADLERVERVSRFESDTPDGASDHRS